MTLTSAQVDHIAQLARLALTDEEKCRFKQQLSAILDHVAQLQTLDTTGIKPTFNLLSGHSRLREDETHPGLASDELFRNAPQTEQGQFRVPLVIE